MSNAHSLLYAIVWFAVLSHNGKKSEHINKTFILQPSW